MYFFNNPLTQVFQGGVRYLSEGGGAGFMGRVIGFSLGFQQAHYGGGCRTFVGISDVRRENVKKMVTGLQTNIIWRLLFANMLFFCVFIISYPYTYPLVSKFKFPL